MSQCWLFLVLKLQHVCQIVTAFFKLNFKFDSYLEYHHLSILNHFNIILFKIDCIIRCCDILGFCIIYIVEIYSTYGLKFFFL